MERIKTPLIVLIVLALIAGGLYFLAKSNSSKLEVSPSPATGYEYYWGNGCPHCANVAAFMDSWSGKDKVDLVKREVWNDQTNNLLMQKRAQSCKISQQDLGVPMLYTPEGKCLIGDGPIIEFLKSLNL